MSIPSGIQQHIYDLLSKSSNVSFVSASHAEGTTLGLTPGQIVTAQVVTVLPYNRAQVSIGTAVLNLELPLPVRVGQSLEMAFVSDDPRPTFAMPRPGETSPPVRLSDASRLLGLLLGSNQMADPQVRASLASVSQLLHQADGDTSLLASVLDEALTYSPQKTGGTASPASSPPLQPQDQATRVAFESNASQILQQVARNARFIMLEAVNQPVSPLPLVPGEEINAAITGTLPGGRVFVQVAGTPLELVLPTAPPADGIIRLTYLSSLPKPLFAMQRSLHELPPGSLSEASRWLSVLEHSASGISGQQMSVLERLNTVISSLPPDSPAFTAIRDESLTYDSLLRRPNAESGTAAAALLTNQQQMQSGNGIVLHDDMAKLLQALIKGNRLALLEAINQQSMPTGLMPGQQVRGDILAALGGGRFMLDVAGRAMEFSLPKGLAAGDRLQLFFITAEPKPTFLLARFGQPGDSTVSSTGRWIGNLLESPLDSSATMKAGGILRAILGESPTDGVAVSQMLQKNVRESGLFYESHLARWFGGDYPLQDILKEPQGKLSMLNQPAVLANPATLADEALMLLKGAEQMLMPAKYDLQQHGPEKMADPRSLPIVQDQLSTLQSGQLLFKGELFPGQQMEWAVRERESERNSDGSQQRSWETTLSVELPVLGAVTTRLTLEKEGQLTIRVMTADSAVQNRLDKGTPALREQFAAAGLAAGEIRVLHEKGE